MHTSKTVFVTGGTGLIGKELYAPLTAAGFSVYSLTIEEQNPPIPGVTWIKGNLFEEEFLRKTFEDLRPGFLLNLAWCASGDYQTSNLNFDFVKAGLSLLKHFAANGGKRAVFTGTCFEYAPKNAPLSETDPVLPPNPYAVCKNSLRELAESFCRQNGISFSYGRIFYVYGRGEHPSRLTASVLHALKAGNPAQVNCSHLERDYMYTKDIAAAFSALLNSEVTGIVNICTGKALKLGHFAQTAARLMGREELLLLKEMPVNQPPIIVGNNTRLTEEVGFQPSYSLEQALREIIEDL